MHADLIFDIGVHAGEDTRYYLHKGFRVVGVEANPELVERLKLEFREPIRTERLILLNVGIAETEGQMQFWICDDVSEWSSFHRDIASRENAKHRPITVESIRFAALLERYGVPFYCKIDIEGNDRLCLIDLDARDKPSFVSYEMPLDDGISDFSLLSAFGYKRFKIVSQVTRAQPTRAITFLAAKLPTRMRDRLHRVERKLRGKARDANWRFPFGASGPFGEDTPGRWLDYDEAISMWRHLSRLDKRFGLDGLGDWYDVHAGI